MPFPPGVQTVTLTGHQTLADGAGRPLPVRIRPVPSRVVGADWGVVVEGDPVVVDPDDAGQWTVTLVATDAAGFDPTGWAYRVETGGDALFVSLPAALVEVDLAELVPAGADEGEYVLVPGPPGPEGPAGPQGPPGEAAPITVGPDGSVSVAAPAFRVDSSGTAINRVGRDPGGYAAYVLADGPNPEDERWAQQMTPNSGDWRLTDSANGVDVVRVTPHPTTPTVALAGVVAAGSKNGLAAIRLAGFKATAGAPTSGAWAAGDVVLDAAGTLHLCTAGGTPGTWT